MVARIASENGHSSETALEKGRCAGKCHSKTVVAPEIAGGLPQHARLCPAKRSMPSLASGMPFASIPTLVKPVSEPKRLIARTLGRRRWPARAIGGGPKAGGEGKKGKSWRSNSRRSGPFRPLRPPRAPATDDRHSPPRKPATRSRRPFIAVILRILPGKPPGCS
jgi:hypothetical protein